MKVNIGEIKLKKKINIGEIKVGVKKIAPMLENLEITPTTEDQSFKSALYGFDNVTVKKVTSEIDSNIKPEYIKEGVNILGVDGGYSGIDTSNATATAADLLKDKTAYANGQQITGTIEEYDGSFTGNVGSSYNAIIDDSLLPTYTGSNNNQPINQMIKKFPNIDTSNWKSTACLFKYCKNLTEFPQLDTSQVTTMAEMFHTCSKLTEPPQLYTGNVTSMYQMFYACNSLIIIPKLDTGKVKSMNSMFNGCKNLVNIPELEANTINDISGVLYNCEKLEDFGGFKNLGMAYTSKTNNSSSYKLDLSRCTLLTHDSLMNVINNLYDLNLTYDVANGGTLYTQQLVLGSTNLAKLTSEEISIATSKGWTVS